MVLSINDAKRICKKDLLDSSPSAFVEKNAAQVQVCVSSWMTLCEDIGASNGCIRYMLTALFKHGLRDTCARCAELAETVLANVEFTDGDDRLDIERILSEHMHDNTVCYIMYSIVAHDLRLSGIPLFAAVLQMLLFPERFTYWGGDIEGSVRKFTRVNDRCRAYEYNLELYSHLDDPDCPRWQIWDRSTESYDIVPWHTRYGEYANCKWPGPTILNFVREELDHILSGRFVIDESDCGFTSGSTNQTPADTLNKWKKLAKEYPCYKGMIQYPLPGGENGFSENGVPKLIGVPKTFSEFRIIAPESPLMNYWGTAALAALRRCIHESGAAMYINERDQEANRKVAELGAFEGMATIDMSSASDSISKALFFAVLPSRLHELYMNFNSMDVTLPSGGKKKLFTLFTSGHPLTWLTEACYFLALMRVAVRLCGFPDYRDLAFVYGDDIEVPCECYATACELLQLFGHKVNMRKSYSDGYFRESCGGWYYLGTDVTPLHWPRRVVTSSNVSLVPALVTLQHLSFEHQTFWKLERFRAYCETKATELAPQMTYSAAFEPSEDLWDLDLDPVSSDMARHWVVLHPRKARERTPFIDHLVYYQYLEYGPSYDDPLSELLGISSSRFRAFDTKGQLEEDVR